MKGIAMYSCLCVMLFAALPTVQEITDQVLHERQKAENGIVSFQVKTPIDVRQPVAEKVISNYTVYFRDGNARMDEVRQLANDKIVKSWSVHAFGRRLRTYNEDDNIIIDVAGKRTFHALGIIDPLLLGLAASRTVSVVDQPEILSYVWPKEARSIVEQDMIDGAPMWKVTTTHDVYRATYWVDPQMKFSIAKYRDYEKDTLRTELLCKFNANETLYFPREILFRQFDDQGKLISEEVTSIIEAKFNVNVPDTVFAMKALGIPAGRTVLNFVRVS